MSDRDKIHPVVEAAAAHDFDAEHHAAIAEIIEIISDYKRDLVSEYDALRLIFQWQEVRIQRAINSKDQHNG